MASDAQRRAALERLGESEDSRAKAIASLTEQCIAASQQPEQKDVALDLAHAEERLLLRFLRHKKYDSAEALKSVIAFHRYMRAVHDIPDGEPAPKTYPLSAAAPLIHLGLFIVCPGRDVDGRMVVVCSDISLAQKMMSEMDKDDISRAFTMFFWELGQSDDAQTLGITFIQDMSTYSIFQMRSGMKSQASMNSKQKKTASMSSDAMPLKYGHFYIVDAPWYFSVAWAVIRNFMKKKLRERCVMLPQLDQPPLTHSRSRLAPSQRQVHQQKGPLVPARGGAERVAPSQSRRYA